MRTITENEMKDILSQIPDALSKLKFGTFESSIGEKKIWMEIMFEKTADQFGLGVGTEKTGNLTLTHLINTLSHVLVDYFYQLETASKPVGE